MELSSLASGISARQKSISAYQRQGDTSRYCYLIAGVHGDEPEGAYVQHKLVEWIERNRTPASLIIVPELNPDGLAAGTRCNANGVDLNRNLPASNWLPGIESDRYYSGNLPLSEPENRFLLDLFKQYPPGFILSFHSWKPMLNSNGDCEEILQLLYKHNQYPIVREEIDDHPTPGSLGSYANEHMKTPVLTFECPTLDDRPDFDSIWKDNKTGLVALMQSGLIEKLLNG